MRRFILIGLLSASVAFGATAPDARALKAGVLSPVLAAPEIRLIGTDGKPLNLARFRGKVVLLAFGYSHCAAVCPITLATLAGARRKLGAAADGVQVVYVTVDPERDDAARMKKYLATFDATFIGGVGTRADIDAAQRGYGVSSSKVMNEDGSYVMAHSSSIYMIDRAGGLRAVMPYGHSANDFAHDLGILLGT
jgi:protein SCO1/2